MKRIAVSALALALSAAAAGGAIAGAQDYGRGYDDSRYDNDRYDRNDRRFTRNDVAQVIRVEPMYDRYASGGYERQECWNERTNAYDDGYYRDSNGRLYRNGTDSNTNGTLIGALIGGALGNQAGKGDGRKAATIGGAVVGGIIGNNIDRNNDASGTGYNQYRDNSGVVRRCRTVTDYDNGNQTVVGYNVTYRYAGQTYNATTRTRPGRTMRVRVEVTPQDSGVAYRR
jgi:uncharacterized protein YcfJ